MIVYYDATERVDEYGKTKFYEEVREHITEIFEKSALEVNGDDKAIIDIYQRYAYAFVIGALNANPMIFADNFFEELSDPIADWRAVEDRSGEVLRAQGYLLDDASAQRQMDEMASTIWTEMAIPNTYGSAEQQNLAKTTALALFVQSVQSQTGLAGLVHQLYPGRYLNHHGDDFKGLVLVCEHESLF